MGFTAEFRILQSKPFKQFKQLKHKSNLKAKQWNRREKLQNHSAEYSEI